MWAVRTFYSLLEEHNKRSDEKCLPEVLCVEEKALLCHWLCIFMKEARRKDGEEYTQRSASEWTAAIHQFETGAARIIRELHNVYTFCSVLHTFLVHVLEYVLHI